MYPASLCGALLSYLICKNTLSTSFSVNKQTDIQNSPVPEGSRVPFENCTVSFRTVSDYSLTQLSSIVVSTLMS